jgi:hypothetical protein
MPTTRSCAEGGQAATLRVASGSRITKVNQQRIRGLMDLTLFLKLATRPVRLTFVKV